MNEPSLPAGLKLLLLPWFICISCWHCLKDKKVDFQEIDLLLSWTFKTIACAWQIGPEAASQELVLQAAAGHWLLYTTDRCSHPSVMDVFCRHLNHVSQSSEAKTKLGDITQFSLSLWREHEICLPRVCDHAEWPNQAFVHHMALIEKGAVEEQRPGKELNTSASPNVLTSENHGPQILCFWYTLVCYDLCHYSGLV